MRVLRAHALVYAVLAAVGAVAIVFGLNAVYGFINTSSSAAGAQRTATVTKGLIQSSVSASGNVSPAQSATAGFASSGTVTAVDVSVGQHVKAGEVLGKIDPTSAQDTLLAAQANLEGAQSALSTAESGLTASQRLSNTMSLQQDSQAITSDEQQLATDRATLATAQKQLATEKTQLTTDQNLSCPATSASAASAASSSSAGNSATSSSSSSAGSSASGASGAGASSGAGTGASSSGATGIHNTVEAAATGASGASGVTGASAITVGPAVTGVASAIGAKTATLAGTVSPDGSDTTYWFAYGSSASDLSQTSTHLDAGSGTGQVSVSVPLSGLTSATTYYFQLIEQNSTGSSTGAQETFATVAAAAPTVVSGSGTSELTSVLQLSGTVNPNSTATTYWFQYGTTSAYGSRTAAISAGDGSTASGVSADVSGLKPDTQYLFRLVAENAFGTTDGLAVVATTAQSSCVTDRQTIVTDQQAIVTDQQTITRQQQTIATAKETLAQERATIATGATPSPATISADEATVSEDEATVTTDQKDLNETTLTAPLSGVVTAVNDTVGEAVSAGGSSSTSAAAAANTSSSSTGSGASAFTGASSASSSASSSSSSGFVTIDSLGQLEIVSGFAEADATKIAVGEPATITFPALTNVSVAGKVVAVSNTSSVVSNVVTYNETIALVNPPSEVKDGMTADVSVIDQTVANALQLPSSAITTTGTISTVELLKNGKTTVTRVVTGLVGNTTTQIISGLSIGDVVVEPTVTIAASTTSSSSASTGLGAAFTGGGGAGLGGGGFAARSGG